MILNYNKLADEVRNPIKKHIVENKIAISFPNETLYFKKLPEEVISAIYIGCRAENKDEIIDNFKKARDKNPKLEHVNFLKAFWTIANSKLIMCKFLYNHLKKSSRNARTGPIRPLT